MSEMLIQSLTVNAVTVSNSQEEISYNVVTGDSFNTEDPEEGQSFTTDRALKVTAIEIAVARRPTSSGLPVGDVAWKLDIRTVDTGFPSEDTLATSERVPFTTIYPLSVYSAYPFDNDDIKRVVFNFSEPVELSASTQYYFVIKYDNNGTVSDSGIDIPFYVISLTEGISGEFLVGRDLDQSTTWFKVYEGEPEENTASLVYRIYALDETEYATVALDNLSEPILLQTRAVPSMDPGNSNAVTVSSGNVQSGLSGVVQVSSGSAELNNGASNDVYIISGNANGNNGVTGAAVMASGATVGDDGVTGDVRLITGLPLGGGSNTRGDIQLQNGSEGTAGHVVYSKDADGSINWGLTPYTPADSSDWDGTDPANVAEALDRCAALLKTLNLGTGP